MAIWRPRAREIELAVAFVNLHRIAPAHRDVGLSISFEVGEIAADAGAAIGIASDTDGLKPAGPDVAGNRGDRSGLPVSRRDSFMASAASIDAITPTAALSTPAVSHVASAPSAADFSSPSGKASEARGFTGTNRHRDAVAADSGA